MTVPYTVSINWDNWSDVGMAADILRDQLREGKRARVLTSANSLNPAEGAEAFNRILGHSFAPSQLEEDLFQTSAGRTELT